MRTTLISKKSYLLQNMMFRSERQGYKEITPTKEDIAMADESKFEQAKGNIKETVGNATDNKDLENSGKEDKASGKAKEFVENAKDKATEVIDKFTK